MGVLRWKGLAMFLNYEKYGKLVMKKKHLKCNKDGFRVAQNSRETCKANRISCMWDYTSD